MRRAQSQSFQVKLSLLSEFIGSDAAGDDSAVTKPGSHVSKIGWRSAKLLSSGQHIPEYFTQTDNDVLFRSYSFPHSARSEMSIDFARNLITNSVWRSGTQLDVYHSRNARSSKRSREGATFEAINISPLTG